MIAPAAPGPACSGDHDTGTPGEDLKERKYRDLHMPLRTPLID
jgi:hypothetical protein